jgi:hypothetical protein
MVHRTPASGRRLSVRSVVGQLGDLSRRVGRLQLAQTVAPAIMEAMAEQAHVKLSGDINGRYVVTDRRAAAS